MTFHLSDEFIAQYEGVKPPFGFTDAAGTSLGEITFIRTYARLKDDGTKETWVDVCRRVIEGMYGIQKQYVRKNNLPWSNAKAQRSAKDAFDRMFHMKWLPPGRGLWAMGTKMVMEGNSAPLQNCAYVSTAAMTKDNPGYVFGWIMEASMLGIGVGFDGKGAGKFEVVGTEGTRLHRISDDREGWALSLQTLINSYLVPGSPEAVFDYSEIRPAGAPIKTFGGSASGPEPLRELHEAVRKILNARVGEKLTLTDIADIGNLIGVCVVAGNVRRSAELFMGPATPEFLGLKDYSQESGQRRASWSWMSNNSVETTVTEDLDAIVPGIIANGEPGVLWMDTTRAYGRLVDPPNYKDHRAAGYNPCSEMSLESFECCTLVETFPSNHDSLEDYLKTLKYAYLYAKTVTLMTTPWPETNAIMLRNRRIGTGMSGLADFYDARGEAELIRWQDASYGRVRELDVTYSEWLGVRESIKTSTIKPSGTVSLLAGVSPGVHWQPGSKHYFRTVRVGKNDPLVVAAERAGYRTEDSVSDPDHTKVIYFPMTRTSERGEHDVSLLEKLNLVITSQKWWSDNSVSVTLTYHADEASQIGSVLKLARGNLKTVSFLPLAVGTYEQMPYTQADASEIEDATMTHLPIDTDYLYSNGVEAIGEKFCTTDTCTI